MENRRFKKGLDSLDQHLLPQLGPFPVTNPSDITLVDLTASTSDEEANIAAHPQNWIGQEIPNAPEDSAKNLVSLVNFLMPPYQLGNQPGDAKRFDHKGNLLIIKEEPPQTSSSESGTDENEIVEINPQGTMNPAPESKEVGKKPEEEGDRIPVPEKKENREPVPSTSRVHANIGPFPGRIEIDGLGMANFFAQFFKQYDLTIAPKTGKIAGVWYPDGQESQEAPEAQVPETANPTEETGTTNPSPNGATQDLTRIGRGPDTNDQCLDRQEPEIMAHEQDEQEPEITDPLDGAIQHVENIIQMLDAHIAVSPNPAQASSDKETDSGLEELLTHEQESKDDSDSEN